MYKSKELMGMHILAVIRDLILTTVSSVIFVWRPF